MMISFVVIFFVADKFCGDMFCMCSINTHTNIIDVISIKQLHPYVTYNEGDINVFQTQKGVKFRKFQSLSVADFRMSDLRRNHN